MSRTRLARLIANGSDLLEISSNSSKNKLFIALMEAAHLIGRFEVLNELDSMDKDDKRN